MEEFKKKKISKLLSLVLRHQPQTIGIVLDENGWTSVDTLLSLLPEPITFEELKDIVDTNDKKRFSLNADNSLIRANQGHSVNIDLDLRTVEPPEILYHGTVEKFISPIMAIGLQKMNRQHVHLSATTDTASIVAQRRGKPIILNILAQQMFKDGYLFYKSENGVWLTDHVPIQYIQYEK